MSRPARALLSCLLLAVSPRVLRGADGLPLPEAPVRLVIPDARAFDAALGGAYRKALTGEAAEDDPVVSAWRRSQVGAKLEAQWSAFSHDLSWTWSDLMKLQPRALGFALLGVGHLEAVLVVDTPLATLPLALPGGTRQTHAGVSYQKVTAGAADDSEDPERRMGLAWARVGGRLLVATSERGLRAALEAAAAGRGFAAPLPGLISADLDLDALRQDRYFRREFLFAAGPEQGHVRTALRLEAGALVEVREGAGDGGSPGTLFEPGAAAAAGWEPDGSGLWPALRGGLLEPLPVLADRPVAGLLPLPAAHAVSEDRYLVSLEKSRLTVTAPTEEGELAQWRELLAAQPVSGWGYLLTRDGHRRLVFPWPATRQNELEALCRATVERRAGRAAVVPAGDIREIRVGPDLPALALRRSGDFVWVAASAQDLADLPALQSGGDVVRWAKLDLDAVRGESPRWAKAEGPGSPESVRPLSDRLLGLLGWMPATKSLRVERRRSPDGWSERVVFGGER
jgi:hypothetical protein